MTKPPESDDALSSARSGAGRAPFRCSWSTNLTSPLTPIATKRAFFLIDICDRWILLLYCTTIESDRFIAIGNINLRPTPFATMSSPQRSSSVATKGLRRSRGEMRLWYAIDARCTLDMDRCYPERMLHSSRHCRLGNCQMRVVT